MFFRKKTRLVINFNFSSEIKISSTFSPVEFLYPINFRMKKSSSIIKGVFLRQYKLKFLIRIYSKLKILCSFAYSNFISNYSIIQQKRIIYNCLLFLDLFISSSFFRIFKYNAELFQLISNFIR